MTTLEIIVDLSRNESNADDYRILTNLKLCHFFHKNNTDAQKVILFKCN